MSPGVMVISLHFKIQEVVGLWTDRGLVLRDWLKRCSKDAQKMIKEEAFGCGCFIHARVLLHSFTGRASCFFIRSEIGSACREVEVEVEKLKRKLKRKEV